jgi:hypothetical protein
VLSPPHIIAVLDDSVFGNRSRLERHDTMTLLTKVRNRCGGVRNIQLARNVANSTRSLGQSIQKLAALR